MVLLRCAMPAFKDFVYVNKTTEKLDGVLATYFEQADYYLHRKFNLSWIIMNSSFSDVVQSGGMEMIELLEQDVIDVNTIDSSKLVDIPSNVTIGPTMYQLTCKIATFPMIQVHENDNDALQILYLNSLLASLTLNLLFVFTITCLSFYLPGNFRDNFFKYFWAYMMTLHRQTSHRKIISNEQVRIVLFTSLFSVTIFQILVQNLLQVEKVQLERFRKIDSLYQIAEEKLKPIFRDDSKCYHYIQANDIAYNYLFSNRVSMEGRDSKSYWTVEILVEMSHENPSLMNSAAILWNDESEMAERRKICRENPEFFDQHPMYPARHPFEEINEPLTLNARLERKVQERINLFAATLLENGLSLQRFTTIRVDSRNMVQPGCLDSKINGQYRKTSPLSMKYFYRTSKVYFMVMLMAFVLLLTEFLSISI